MHLGSLSLLSKRCQVTWQRQYVKMHILIHHYCRDFTDRYYSIVQTVRINIDFNISMMRKNSQMRIISRSKRPPAAYLLVAVERASTLFSILAFHQLMDRGAWARGPMRI